MKGKRTIIFMILVSIVGALQAVGIADWTELLGMATAGIVVSAIGIAGVVLRFLTTGPVGSSS